MRRDKSTIIKWATELDDMIDFSVFCFRDEICVILTAKIILFAIFYRGARDRALDRKNLKSPK